MIYSVWSHANRAYDYYRTPERSEATSAPKPAHLRFAPLGMAPEDAAWPLPPGAVLIGRGKYPKGYVASPSSPMRALSGFLDFELNLSNLALAGLLGWVAWKYIIKPGS